MAREKLPAEKIAEKLEESKTWAMDGDEKRIGKRFAFEDFAGALAFVNQVGAVAERLDHHPDITFGWGYAEIFVTTHDAGGLTELDFALAKEIDALE